MTDEDDSARAAVRRDIAKKRVKHALPGMDDVSVCRDLTFSAASGVPLVMDIYYPPPSSLEPFPVVILPMAYPDPGSRARAYGPLTSWAQLIAASGMAAVVYGAEAPRDDVHALLDRLCAAAPALRLDSDRIGLLATSGNGTVGLSALMRDKRLSCGALLYPYTMDVDGSTAVAAMARRAGFVNACEGMSVDDLPSDVPMLLVRAGGDQFPGLNAALDRLVAAALVRNLPVSVINHASGSHGFDLDEDTAISRGVVQQVLAYLSLYLSLPATEGRPLGFRDLR
jgi:hypothetical protein